MEVFDQRKVSFVSVTQQFNTATPMGRLVLNVLLVVDRIRCIARDATLRAEVVRQASVLAKAGLDELRAERRGLERDLARHDAEIRKLAAKGPAKGRTTARIADLNDILARVETRLTEVRKQIKQRESENFDDADIAAAFGDFDGVWNSLRPREQAQALSLLVSRVECDAEESAIEVSFHPTGIRTLVDNHREEAA
jgi:site-specific DNA recombinase